jgi:glycosyltransferase involved in cell wall biosynthesis
MENRLIQPLLTIAIPVYNSELFIGQTLQSITSEITENLQKLIQIVLVDNASTDRTFDIINEFNFPCERKIIKNPSNLGRDFSFDECGKQSDGKYIWFLGSQDKLKPKSLEKILSILKQEKYSNILLNFSIENEVNSDLNENNHYLIHNDLMLSNPYDFYRKLGGHALAMSANIIKRENYLNVLVNPLITKDWAIYQRFFESTFSEVYEKSFYFISEPIFVLQQEKDGWWTTPEVFLNFVGLREIQLTSRKLDFKIFLFLMYRGGGKSLRNSIVLGRQVGYRPTFKMSLKLLRLYFFDPRFYFMALPLFYSPKKFVKNFEIS